MTLKFRLFGTLFLVAMAVAVPLLSQKSQKDATPSPSSEVIARGRYLVENAGLCADCHTPRGEKGEFIRERWLMGAPILFKPTIPIPWAEQAPRIAGLPGWSDEAAIKFLTDGGTITGTPARPPMPPYRFSREDAIAVTAYLRSLKTETTTAEKK